LYLHLHISWPKMNIDVNIVVTSSKWYGGEANDQSIDFIELIWLKCQRLTRYY
jgi:hypothetical protein